VIDLREFLAAEAGQAYRAKLSLALMTGKGELVLEELKMDCVRLSGAATVPLMGALPIDVIFALTAEDAGEAVYAGRTYPCDVERAGQALVLRMGSQRQHRCELTPQPGGDLTVRADLKGRPNVKMVLERL